MPFSCFPCFKQQSSKKKELNKNTLLNLSSSPEEDVYVDDDDILTSVTSAKINTVPCKNEWIRIKISKVIDGDTIQFIYLQGHKYPCKLNMRIEGIDAPEMKGCTEKERNAANSVKFLVHILLFDKIVWGKLHKWDKYGGRVVGTILCPSNEQITLSEYLLQNDLVHVYDGKVKKQEWTEKELTRISAKVDKLIKKL